MKSTLNEAFGKAIKHFRSERKLSQQELADYSEVDRSYISDLERGRYNPTLDTIFKLAEIFKIKPSELLARVEKNKKG